MCVCKQNKRAWFIPLYTDGKVVDSEQPTSRIVVVVGQKESRVVHWTAATDDDGDGDCDAAATQLLPGKTAATTTTATATWTKVSKMIKKKKTKRSEKKKTKNTENYEIRALLQFCRCFVLGWVHLSHLSMRFRLSALR